MNVIDRVWSALIRSGWAAALGAACLAVVTASPAAAQAACQDGNDVLVEFLGVGTSNTILMAQTDGTHYRGDIRVRVYCGADGGLVPNATVQITTDTTAPGDAVYNPLTQQWEPLGDTGVEIFLPTGELVISLRTEDPNFSPGQWKAKVGTSTVTVTGAFDVSLSSSDYPVASGALWAQTPELGSLALFGTGAAGLAGYALTRLRARRGRQG